MFLLSFDCDTTRDPKAAIKIQTRLHSVGIRAGYAIPGELLENHWEDYRKLLDLGGYLINHGYREHAAIDPKTRKPYSTFTYRDVKSAVWQQDILDGHKTIFQLTGTTPKVFRTPHFGEFNKTSQLNELYSFLATHEYQISTSTTPVFGFLNGGAYKTQQGITELPLSGTLRKPTQLIDSWGFISAPDAIGRDALILEMEKYLSEFLSGKRLLLNIYFDPADIAEDNRVLDLLVRFGPFSHPGYDKYALHKPL
ncbi:MAG: hypothetical protein RIB30_12085 [Thalassospira sp.]|uniref:hypothetical protein n=1 Tax=Thalassospira sp. TaxID=1912094 RepID=UPI0032ECE227